MADGSKSGIGGVFSTLGEAIATPVKQEVKDIFKEAVQSITGSGSTQDPTEEAKRKADEAKQKQNIQQFFAQMTADQQKLEQERKQREQQEQQAKAQEVQVKKSEEFQKKEVQKQNIAVANAQRGTERKLGTG